MDYQAELDKTIRVAQAISCLVDCIDGLDARYEPLIITLFRIISGEVVQGDVECPNCGRCTTITGETLVGGLEEYVIQLSEVVKMLQLEVIP